MIILRIVLIPFSIIYSLIMFIRNKLYDFNILRSHNISKPLISIGNISTGGTGKTPLTIFTAKYFLNKNCKVGIIARGYRRKSVGTVIVSDGVNINTNSGESGDELILISDELLKDHKGNFCVAAGKDRVEASNLLIDRFNPDVIILDDGFQNRRIKRDLDVVIVDASDYYSNVLGNIFTLPAGNLRESFSGIKRADIVIQNNKSETFEIISSLMNYETEILKLRYKTEYFMDNKNSILQNLKTDAIVFSGIANDNSFIKMIEETPVRIIDITKFSDHYNYTHDDIEMLKSKFSQGSVFITTEKDFIKIKQFKEFVAEYPVYFLKLRIEFPEGSRSLFNKFDQLVI